MDGFHNGEKVSEEAAGRPEGEGATEELLALLQRRARTEVERCPSSSSQLE